MGPLRTIYYPCVPTLFFVTLRVLRGFVVRCRLSRCIRKASKPCSGTVPLYFQYHKSAIASGQPIGISSLPVSNPRTGGPYVRYHTEGLGRNDQTLPINPIRKSAPGRSKDRHELGHHRRQLEAPQ